MPLVARLPADHDPEVAGLAGLFHETPGFVPRSVLTMQRRPSSMAADVADSDARTSPRAGQFRRIIPHLSRNG